MTSSILLLKNINTLLISLESLDLYTTDSLIAESKIINITELFIFKNHNLLKYNKYINNKKLYYITIIFYQIIQKTTIKNFKNNLKYILKDICKTSSKRSNYSTNTNSYIQRFILNYRINIQPYLVGYDKYNDESWLIKISMINLLLLYELYESRDIYRLFLYLKYNDTHI